MTRAVHPIEQQSYAILRSRADTSALPPWTRAVAERVAHASADLGYLSDLVCDEQALTAGARALRSGAAVVADSEMVAAGVTSREVICRVRDPCAAALAKRQRKALVAAGVPGYDAEPPRQKKRRAF